MGTFLFDGLECRKLSFYLIFIMQKPFVLLGSLSGIVRRDRGSRTLSISLTVLLLRRWVRWVPLVRVEQGEGVRVQQWGEGMRVEQGEGVRVEQWGESARR